MKTAQKTTQYQREFTFLDAKRSKVVAEVELTTRNGYLEFTACGDYENGRGQVFDNVKPANDQQKQFIDLWHKWHLKQVNEDFESDLDSLIDEIEEIEEDRKGESLSDLDDGELIDLIEEKTSFTMDDVSLCAALVRMFDLTENDLDDIEINGNRVTVQGVDYLAGTDDEMDQAWDESLENYIDECILPEVHDSYKMYFDNEKWKRDARMDGRGHSLNSYDGGEESTTINGVDYYAYRN